MPDFDGNPEGFLAECSSPYKNLFALFEDDGETGYFYLYEQDGRGILEAVWIYNRRSEFIATEGNTEVTWSDEEQHFLLTINKEPRHAMRIVEQGNTHN